jgi:hypothetical protein
LFKEVTAMMHILQEL